MALTTFPMPAYQTGKHCSLAAGTPITVGSDGVTLTYGTALNLKTQGVFDHWKLTARNVGQEKHPADGLVENNVPLFESFDLEVGEIAQPSVPGNLQVLWASFMYFRFEVDTVYPGATTTCKLAVIATRANGEYEYEVIEDVGMHVLRLKPCGVAPYYGTGTVPF